MNKERGGIARQFVLGIVQTADGLPLMHTVHPGNVAETKTLQARDYPEFCALTW